MTTEPTSNPLYPTLSAEEIASLVSYGTRLELEPGATLFGEGDAGTDFYVVLEGELKITRRAGGGEIVLVQHGPGQFSGALSLFSGDPTLATGSAVGKLSVLQITLDGFQKLMAACPDIATKIIGTMAQRQPEADALVQQREKMAALGKLSAGLAHELNNPAAAARRAAARLREALEAVQRSSFRLGEKQLSESDQDLLLGLQHSAAPPGLDSLALSEREDEIADWLDERDLPSGCELSASLAEAGFTESALETLAAQVSDPDTLSESLAWLGSSLEAVELLRTVEQSADRISDLVTAIKAYSYMDQAPQQEVCVEDSLETTLTILQFKWKHGVSVVRDYAPHLPGITAYGSELNQVWTNLIDNALDALDGKGHLFIRTAKETDCILVEIGDDGPGIPEEVQSRIFEPFFTTKEVGKGTGLGLDTAYRIVVTRHGGDLSVVSEPGDTRFQVRLPIEAPAR